jgi:hypothetical protein
MSAVLAVRNLFRGWNGIPLGSGRFDSEWERFQPRSSQGIQGCWTGKWKSHETRKELPLKCILTRIAPGTYMATFSTKYFDLFNLSYEVNFRVAENRNEFQLEGVADLGRFAGGVHHFTGIATPSVLTCAYRSLKDEGEMHLGRLL